MFVIPAAKAVTELFVIKTSWYAKKDTGEIMASVQALAPIPADQQNAKGYEVTEYRADASILEHINLDNGPTVIKFESIVRPVTDRFGRTTNTQILAAVIPENVRQAAPASAQGQQGKSEPKPQ